MSNNPIQNYECGVYRKITPPAYLGLAPAYVDRYGNEYAEEELGHWNFDIQANHCVQIEDFVLLFVNNQNNPFSQAEMETICDVFDYLSGIIEANSGERAIIRLFKDPNLPATSAAVGTSFFPNQCGLGHSLVHQQLFTGGVNTPQHGLIAVNANLSNFYIGPENGIGSTQIDFFTVILHEALHVLGFGSQISLSGAPAQGFYTLWGLNLANDDDEPMIETVVPGTNDECCADYVFNSADYPDMPDMIWDQDCGPDNIHFDVAQQPPVNGEYTGQQDLQTFLNVLSHLDRACGTEHYVMNSGVLTGTDGVQRTLTDTELSVICRLGYTLPNECEPDCIAIAVNDGAYFVALNGEIQINIGDLLANDFPTNGTFALLPNCGNDAGIGVNLNGNQIIVQGNALGAYTFCYALTGCGGNRCDVAIVRVVVTNPAITEACENLDECQINAFWDFELFGSDDEMRMNLTLGGPNDPNLGFTFYTPVNNFWDNTPDLVGPIGFFPGNFSCDGPHVVGVLPPNGNQMVRMVMRRVNDTNFPEGICFPLCEPIFPGMSGRITFLAMTPEACLGFSPQARLEFSENSPVAGALVYDNPSMASPSWFVPITSNQNTNPVFDAYTVEFTNESSACWNYLYVSSFANEDLAAGSLGAIYVDAVRVELNNNLLDILDLSTEVAPEEPCLGDQVNVKIEICNNVECAGNTFASPEALVTAQLPAGLTLVPNTDFPTLTHLINEGDIPAGGCIELTLSLQVSSDEAFDGQTLPINLQFNPIAPCFEDATLSAGTVTPMICNPEFACPCTGPNDLNIDAGDVSTNPNDPNITPVSILAIDIPANIVTLGGVPTLMKPCIAIKGNLLIDNNFNLFIFGGEIRMQPGSKIIVAPGSTLRLFLVNQGSGTERGIHGCEQMWRSIEVQPSGNLYTAFNVIQDAEFAFDLRGTGGAPVSFNSYSNDFDRNYVGIRVNNSAFAALNQPYPAVLNRFRATSLLLPNFSSDIYNWNATAPFSGLSLANTTFFLGSPSAPSLFNEFNGLRNGILADKCALDVHHARFLNAQGGLDYSTLNSLDISNSESMGIFARSCAPFNVRNCTFDGAAQAIHAPQSSPDIRNSLIQNVDGAVYCLPGPYNRILIFDNDIFARGLGLAVEGGGAYTRVNIALNDPIQIVPSALSSPVAVRLKNMPDASAQIKHVTNNNIVLQPGVAKGIDMQNTGGWWIHGNDVQYASPNSDVEGGINLSKADNNKIQENTITATGNAGDNAKVGIFVIGSEHNKICCNTTENLFTGFQFLGVSDDTKLRYSDIGNHVFGLLCGNSVAPGLTAIIGDQLHAGNAWNGLYDATGAAHYGGEQDVERSEFFVELPQSLPLWPDNPLSPAKPGEWFRDLPGSTTACISDPSNCPPLPLLFEQAPDGPGGSTGTGRLLTGNELAIGRGEYGGTGTYSLATQFEGERSLYAKIKSDSSLLGQDSLVDQFFANASQGTIGALFEVERQMVALGIPVEQEWGLLLELERGADSLIGLIHQTDSAYQLAPTAADSLALQNQKMNLLTQLSTGQTTWQGLIGDLRASWLTNATAIIGQNATIPDTNMLIANRKALNRIWLETLASGNYNATQSQLDDLLDIALQCYYEGGDAVLQARALYGTLAQPLDLEDALICTGGGEERSQVKTGKAAGFSVKVVPNPTKDRFSIQATGVPTDALMRLQIVDLNGKILKDTRIRNGEVLAYAFAPGLYVCRVLAGDAPARVVKFIVVP